MKYIKSILAIFTVCGLAQATVMTSNPVDDARVPNLSGNPDGPGTGIADRDSQNIVVGDAANNWNISKGIYIYELPPITAGDTISKINAEWFYNDIVGTPPNLKVDIFFKNTGSVVAADYQAAALLSMDNFLTPESAAGTRYAWDDDALIALFNNAYDKGDKYVVFRLSLQDWGIGNEDSKVDGYRIGAKEHQQGARHWPTLTITTIPEPGSVRLLMLGIFGTFGTR
ncbi:MAG: hypothetical protein WC959_11870 [Kiritimatiellales bacterium]